jgi:ADP-ribose pyrophosphatase YjhB (NUDIX family)
VNFPRQLRALAYRAFYGMPYGPRRRLARMISPKYLVGAVAVITDAEAEHPGRLLLLRQPSRSGWNLPAGLLKRREPPAMGCARELFEESGIRIDADQLTPGVPNAIVHTVGVVDTVFFGSVPASTATLEVDGGEVLEAAWFPMDDLPRLSVNTAHLLGTYGIGPRAAHRA